MRWAAKIDLLRFLYIRNIVSKKRRRMLVAGYDLDMSYITPQLLAMSFPSENVRAVYRNPLWQVRDVLDLKHKNHYKIYNLCVEESYDPSNFHGRVEMFPFDDNQVPPLSLMKKFCESVHMWLSSDPQNVAVVHCMAGKGRTGVMVCAYLVYTGFSADEALDLYANKRTTNNQGVSIPSQRRYVKYWKRSLTFPRGGKNGPPSVHLPEPIKRELRRIRLYDVRNIDSVLLVVSELQKVPGQQYYQFVEIARTYCRHFRLGHYRSTSPRYFRSFVEGEDKSETTDELPHLVVEMETEHSVIYTTTFLQSTFEPKLVSGDVRIIFYEKMIGGRLFYTCFNTAFVGGSVLQLSRTELDKVTGTGKSICGPNFSVELLFGPSSSTVSPRANNHEDASPENGFAYHSPAQEDGITYPPG